MGLFSAGASIVGGLAGMAGGLFGGGGGKSAIEELAEETQWAQMLLAQDAYNKYRDLYNKFYWPIEEYQAGNYLTDIKAMRPFEERMRDYQLGRGDELIGLATDTNPILDENKKSLIRRLTEGEDVLADRYRSQATADVAAAYNQQRNTLNQQMALHGINPNSGAWANRATNLAQNQALNTAGARTQATRLAEDTSLQRQAQALNYYTNPSMLYNPGTITPGLKLGDVLGGGGGSGGASRGGSGGSGSGLNNFFGGLGLVGSGLDHISNAGGFSKFGSAIGSLFS